MKMMMMKMNMINMMIIFCPVAFVSTSANFNFSFSTINGKEVNKLTKL